MHLPRSVMGLVHVKCCGLRMDAPRLPHHLNREVVRRGGVLWTEFWEAANGTSIGWNHLRRWLRNPSEEAIVDCQCAQLYGVSSKCVARHASWGLRTCSCDCCQACANNVRYGICLYCTQVDCLLKLFRRIIHRLLVVSPEGVFTADFWPFKNIGANYLPSLEPFIAKEVIIPSSRLLFSTVVACDLKWPDLDNIEACLGQFIAAVGGSSEDLLRIFAKELRVDQWLKSGCGAPILKPGKIFEPGLLSCEQDLLPDWKWIVQHFVFRIKFIVADWALQYIQRQKWKVIPKRDRSGLIAYPPIVGLHPDTESILGIKLNSDLRPEFPLSQADFSGPIDLLSLSEEEKKVFNFESPKIPWWILSVADRRRAKQENDLELPEPEIAPEWATVFAEESSDDY